MEFQVPLNIKQQLIYNIDLMHLSIEKMKIKISEKKIVTAAIRVN
jgi:hypothetical protein